MIIMIISVITQDFFLPNQTNISRYPPALTTRSVGRRTERRRFAVERLTKRWRMRSNWLFFFNESIFQFQFKINGGKRVDSNTARTSYPWMARLGKFSVNFLVYKLFFVQYSTVSSSVVVWWFTTGLVEYWQSLIIDYKSREMYWILDWLTGSYIVRFILTARHCVVECPCYINRIPWSSCRNNCLVKLRYRSTTI